MFVSFDGYLEGKERREGGVVATNKGDKVRRSRMDEKKGSD